VAEDTGSGAVAESAPGATFLVPALPPGPYPEDRVPPAREADPLRWPAQRPRAAGSAGGPVIGTQPAAALRDIALVSTVLSAAKFQKVRPPPPPGGCPFLITRADLRSYRRAPVPGHLLVLVLDWTCTSNRDWEQALRPHLRWAYVGRARVTLIQVGSAEAREPLRAEQINARNLLSPRVGAALDSLHQARGTATPLAHGLDLATRTLRKELQHGRGAVRQARLVVFTDGRGNVPLAASRAARLDDLVSRQGVEDALQVARALRALNHVEAFFLNPLPRQYADLPLTLAEALGATVQEVPRRRAAPSAS
jgi:magnesium chelatase subunit D